MRATIRLALLGGLGIAVSTAAQAEGPAQVYTLNQAIDLALQQNPRLAAARRQSNATHDTAGSVRGHLLPAVHVGLTYDYVRANEGLDLSALAGGAGTGMGTGGATQGPPPYRINFWGGDFSVGVAQPVLGLLHISQDFAAADQAAGASEADVTTAEDELRTQVEYGLLTLFEARAEKGIAQASHEQLTEQLQVANAKFKDGALTKADVLRFQVAAANADQQVIQAQVQEETSKDQLLGLLGVAPTRDQVVDFADPTDELAKRPPPAVPPEHELEFAEEHRPEMLSAERQSSAAWHRKQARYLNLLPEFNMAYSYYRLINVPGGLPTDINLFGLSASWNVWDWGVDYFAAHAAGEQLEAAKAQHEAERQQVDVEVRTRAAQQRAAAHAVQVASDTIAQAEEAFRVTQSTVRAGAATTTDLLDAQAALTQARLNLVRSKYEELRARSALARALGVPRS